MDKIACLIILYNKNIKESKTYQSLLSMGYINENNFIVVIWNNGPTPIVEEKKDGVFYHQTINNISLSKIYNSFLDKYSADIYIFFDDDTELNNAFISGITKINKSGVYIPKIVDSTTHNLIYPTTENGNIIESNCINNYLVISAGSGLCITKDVSILMKEEFGSVFDERFVLYGIDTTFFRRIYKLRRINKIMIYIQNSIYHDLSRLSGKDSLWRKQERLLGDALQVRYYQPYRMIHSLFKSLIVLLIDRKFKLFFNVIKTLITGHHPRAKIS